MSMDRASVVRRSLLSVSGVPNTHDHVLRPIFVVKNLEESRLGHGKDSHVGHGRDEPASQSVGDEVEVDENARGSPHDDAVSQSGEDDVDVPAELEDVVEALLCGLRDTDTVVRWSAAKGVGRITGRLPRELGELTRVPCIGASTAEKFAWSSLF